MTTSRILQHARAAALALTLAVAACDDPPTGPGQTPPPPAPPAVASVELSPGILELVVGGTRAVSATPRAANGAPLSDRAVSWASSEPAVARVDQNGNVTALAAGSTTITATSEGKTGQLGLVVSAPVPPAPASVHVGLAKTEIVPGESVQLTATVRAADGSVLPGHPVTWTSSNERVAKMYTPGVLLAHSGGSTVVTATSGGKSSQVTVTVPQELVYRLQAAGEKALPLVVRTTVLSADTQGVFVIRKLRRVKLVSGGLRLSTVEPTYRQRFVLQTYEQTVQEWPGVDVIAGAETFVKEEIVEDHGTATEYDMLSGQPIYRSSLFADHRFVASVVVPAGARTQTVRQAIPGQGTLSFDLVFTR